MVDRIAPRKSAPPAAEGPLPGAMAPVANTAPPRAQASAASLAPRSSSATRSAAGAPHLEPAAAAESLAATPEAPGARGRPRPEAPADSQGPAKRPRRRPASAAFEAANVLAARRAVQRKRQAYQAIVADNARLRASLGLGPDDQSMLSPTTRAALTPAPELPGPPPNTPEHRSLPMPERNRIRHALYEHNRANALRVLLAENEAMAQMLAATGSASAAARPPTTGAPSAAARPAATRSASAASRPAATRERDPEPTAGALAAALARAASAAGSASTVASVARSRLADSRQVRQDERPIGRDGQAGEVTGTANEQLLREENRALHAEVASLRRALQDAQAAPAAPLAAPPVSAPSRGPSPPAVFLAPFGDSPATMNAGSPPRLVRTLSEMSWDSAAWLAQFRAPTSAPAPAVAERLRWAAARRTEGADEATSPAPWPPSSGSVQRR